MYLHFQFLDVNFLELSKLLCRWKIFPIFRLYIKRIQVDRRSLEKYFHEFRQFLEMMSYSWNFWNSKNLLMYNYVLIFFIYYFTYLPFYCYFWDIKCFSTVMYQIIIFFYCNWCKSINSNNNKSFFVKEYWNICKNYII